MGKELIPLAVFSDIPTPVWVALSGMISGIGTWIISMRQINISIDRARLKIAAETLADESAERAAFRATLMADISSLRMLVKDCDTDRDVLRTRVNAAEEQILVLKASNEIMERWVKFFKERDALDLGIYPSAVKRDAAP